MKPIPGVKLSDFTVNAGACLGGIGVKKDIPIEKLAVKYSVGDILWVRETYAVNEGTSGGHIYRADHCDNASGIHQWGGGGLPKISCSKWVSPIFMPRGLSRITLEVTDVRIERLQDISEKDAIAEGVDAGHYIDKNSDHGESYKIGFARLWDSINGPGSWEANPWVSVTTFKRADT